MTRKKVLLFDCDGVIGETELYGHLPAFNQMWKEFGVPWAWSAEQYGEKLNIGGGKERMLSLFSDNNFLKVFTPPERDEEKDELIKKWHKKKTEIYKKIISTGKIPARPGIIRIITDALNAGWTCAMCSTSAIESVEAVLVHAVGKELTLRFSGIFAGDMVKSKKPAPDVYNLAAKKLRISPEQCVVIEDSRNGLLAARAAGMKCLVTVNEYTNQENFNEAILVISSLGDYEEKCRVLRNPDNLNIGSNIDLSILQQILDI